jgi:two-component system sensor histidine kinase UhpB
MLGYAPEEFRETNAAWRERLHPDDRERVSRIYEDYVAGRLPEYRVEFRQRTKSGDWKWILSLGKVQERDDAGRPMRMLGTHTDIDALKRTEATLQAVSARLLTVQEAERAHLARELHDQIGQALTAMKITLQNAGAQVTDPKVRHQLATGVAIADQTLAQVRGLSLDLRPPQLDHLGLAAALRWHLARQAQLAGLQAVFTDDGTPRQLPEPVAISAYRIAQEAVTNAIRHAGANTLRVACGVADGSLRLEISDDGVGFVPHRYAGGSLGLASMHERAALVGGELRIDSTPGSGTRVNARLPLAAFGPGARA